MDKKNREYRFFYHYYKQYKCLSVHFRGKCYKVNHVVCKVACESKWNKTQPNLVMQGFAKELKIECEIAFLS